MIENEYQRRRTASAPSDSRPIETVDLSVEQWWRTVDPGVRAWLNDACSAQYFDSLRARFEHETDQEKRERLAFRRRRAAMHLDIKAEQRSLR